MNTLQSNLVSGYIHKWPQLVSELKDLREEVYYYRFEYENYDRDNFEDWCCFDEIYLIEE